MSYSLVPRPRTLNPKIVGSPTLAMMENLLRKLDGFCCPGSLFWITSSSCDLHTDLGQYNATGLTVCFEDTAVLWTVSLLFWVSAGLRLLWSSAEPKHPLSRLSVVKVVVISVPIITAVCDFFYTIYGGIYQQAASFQYLQPIAVLTTSVLAAAVAVHERWLGVHSSALMFLLWLGLVIYGGLKMWTLVALAKYFGEVSDKFRFVTFCLQFATYLIEFALWTFPDRRYFTTQQEINGRKHSPEENATFLSKAIWWWLNRLIWLGWRKSLEFSHLTDLNEQDRSSVVVPRFMKYWNNELSKSSYCTHAHSSMRMRGYQPLGAVGDYDTADDDADTYRQKKRKRGPSLVMAIAKTIWKVMAMAAVLKLFQDLLLFVNPQILRLLINFVSDTEVPGWKGYFYAALLFVIAITQAILLQQHFIRTYIAGMRTRTCVIAAIYSKALRLSSRARQEKTVGELLNLMSVDAQRLMDVMTYSHSVWSAPLQIILALVFLWFTMGSSIFVGVAVLIILIPINTGLTAIQKRYQVQQMAKKDERLKLISEVLNGIKVIKLYAWEIPFQKQIVDIREAELRILRKSRIVDIAATLTWYTAPFLVTLATIGTYVQVHENDPNNRLTAERAFVTLSLFNILRFPVYMLPQIISSLVEASVSVKRVSNFLKTSELDPRTVQWHPEAATGDELSVSVVNGTFTWNEIERPTLSNLNMLIKPGQLVAVVGQVGAGKSSLISSLLGNVEKVEGSVTLRGSIAYVPQQAWILNTTLKENVLFGKSEESVFYETVLHSCALDPDLKVLPGGDMAEIGEKGINLSGGQKQRVSLARAVYEDADVYLMDDPLSAVDSHVGTHIFEKVIGPQGLLKEKVRILTTHGLTHLAHCDLIVVMDGGRIVEQGSYSELIANNGTFAELLHTYANMETKDDPEHASDVEALSTSARSSELESVGVCGTAVDESILISKEKAQKGVVKLSVILTYCKACVYWMAGAILLMNCILNGFAVASNFWLADWSNAEDRASPNSTVDIGYYLSIFSVLGFSQAFFAIFASLFLVLATIKGSSTIHSKMLINILRSPMSFFDTTPLGRILNRFSKDIYNIDEVIPKSIDDFLAALLMVVSVILVVSITTPVFIVVILPLGIFYWFVQRFYIATSRQLERLVSVSRSPIYSHFQESIDGASSIRAYKQQKRFMQECEKRVDNNNIAYYLRTSANRWLAVRLEFIGNFIVFFAALFAAVQRNYSEELNLHIDAGIVGLSISYALLVTEDLNWMVRMASELEANIVAVERTKEYSESPTEAPAFIEDHTPPPQWPSQGHINFDHYSTRYREGLGLVLRDITIEIQAGSKVGIVGRTGAGKTSLTLALFRIIEAASGSIVIDGIDISSIGLQDLRSRITIIPQDPVIFAGTLRANLDPFDHCTDDEIWHALVGAHLQTFVSTLEGGLQYAVAERGENLSVGQRQLVCLARALLRQTKILVLDEATAAVDLETDNLIQGSIRSEFASCTVLTIAHRINTIMDYDYVMVLQEGSVTEYDTPQALLDKKGHFYSMAKHARLV